MSAPAAPYTTPTRVIQEIETCKALQEIGLRHKEASDCKLCKTRIKLDGRSCFAVETSSWPQVSRTLRTVGLGESHPLRKLTDRRLIDQDPLSESTLEWVQSRMQKCRAMHGNCATTKLCRPPASRLIHLGQSNADIRLIDCTNLQAQYAALSHCWGKDHNDSMKTTKANLADHLEFISFESLPKTFQDAIEITRKLNIEYVWIDSLSIIQDDPRDWHQEARKMGQIYSSASVTIVVSRASADSEGFLQPRVDDSVEIIDVYNSSDEALQIALTSWSSKLDWTGERFRAIRGFIAEDEPLSKRAWALQERYLSRRKLLFCQDQIYWECEETTAAEDGIESTMGEFRVGSLWSKENKYKYWYRMVGQYSSRGLKYEEDVFPAFAGVAKCVADFSGDDYLAGLWVQDVSRGLSWVAQPPFRWRVGQGGYLEVVDYHDNPLRKTSPYEGPSWSWASRRGGTDYEKALGRPDLEHPWKRVSLIRLISHSSESVSVNGDVFDRPKNCSIEIEAHLIPIEGVDIMDMLLLATPDKTSDDDTIITVGQFDEKVETTSLFLVPLAKTYQYAEWYLTFLIVQPSQQKDGSTEKETTYVRVGMGHHWLCAASQLGTSSPFCTEEKYEEYYKMKSGQRSSKSGTEEDAENIIPKPMRTPLPDYIEMILRGDKTTITLV